MVHHQPHVFAPKSGQPAQAILLFSVLYDYGRLCFYEYGNLLVHYTTA